MPLLRLLLVALYPACLLAVMARRPGQAAAAVRARGATVELGVWAQSPRRLRIVLLIAVALLLTCAGRLGGAFGLVFALITAPIAAAGTLRRLTIASRGLLIDGEWTGFEELSGFTIDAATGRLIFLPREPGRVATTLVLGRAERAIAIAALSNHLSEIRSEAVRDPRASAGT